MIQNALRFRSQRQARRYNIRMLHRLKPLIHGPDSGKRLHLRSPAADTLRPGAHGLTVPCKGAAQISGSQHRHLTLPQKAEISHTPPDVLPLLAEVLRHTVQQHQRTHHQMLCNGRTKRPGGIGQRKLMAVIEAVVCVFVCTC